MSPDVALERALKDSELHEALADARALGFLGPGPIDAHVRHAVRFAVALGDRFRGPALDLGAGGGIPGLALARTWPEMRWVLLDSSQRRTSFLRDAAAALALGNVDVVTGRAEEVGRDPLHRASYATVVARGFGPPAVTAECGAPLLAPGGHLAVSEPPSRGTTRWPEGGIGVLSLRTAATADPGIWVAELCAEVDDRYPRRTGIPAKRPLF